MKKRFFEACSYALVANTDLSPFPAALHEELRKLGKRVYPVDLGGSRYVGGDEAFNALLDLPTPVEAAIADLPRRKLPPLIDQVEQLEIPRLWLLQSTSLEVERRCLEHGITLFCGDARIYTRQGFSVGRALAKILGKF